MPLDAALPISTAAEWETALRLRSQLERGPAAPEKIAADTGGQYYPLSDASQLQPVMNNIGLALTCQTVARSSYG